MTGDTLAGIGCIILILVHLMSIVIAGARLRRTPAVLSLFKSPPPVTIIRPLCGIDPFIEATLRSSFSLDCPSYELLLCVAEPDDPVIPIARRLMEAHPEVKARLLLGDDRISANPKLNNCLKGWAAARHEWVILADSNVLMPPDYVQQLMAAWRADTGLVCSTPIGSRPSGFWAEVECAFLNTLQARWQYAGEAMGLGFAQGKSMLWRRSFLAAKGGLAALASDIAEDAAATKLVREAGLRVHLVAAPFQQPLGKRSFREVWARQLRWARLRRVTFPAFFAPEILSGSGPAMALGVYAALESGESIGLVVLALLVAWYGPEVTLAARKGWHVSWRYPLALLVRDGLILALWTSAWLKASVVWRGNPMTLQARSLAWQEPLAET